MANQEHIDLLKQGREVWNQWRKEYPDIQPDLHDADLSGIELIQINFRDVNLSKANFQGGDLRGTSLFDSNLIGADLRNADLRDVDLSHTSLSGADLRGAKFNPTYLGDSIMSKTDGKIEIFVFFDENEPGGTNFLGSDLYEADLSGADLRGIVFMEASLNAANFNGAYLNKANLIQADLRDTNFSNANLTETDLTLARFGETNLNGTDLSRSTIGGTLFEDIDLRSAKGLESVIHSGPSTIGTNTIVRSAGEIPEIFLRGAGLPNTLITYIRSLVVTPLDFYSCFISYSSKDHIFAERLYSDLQREGVRCWFAPKDLKIGAKIRSSIDTSIHLHDKLLLVLSLHAVTSQWVEQEVETALEKERKENRTILFPIRLDNTVMKIEDGWPALVRNTRNIGDFTHWKRHDDAYQKAFDRLLQDLKAET